jgi:hypothetical protein
MVFVTTWLAAAGLLATSIPIIIHLLFRHRRKTYEWAAMRLLQEAIRRHQRRSRLESLLLLSLRCLTILLFGIALAQPIVQGSLFSGLGSRFVVLVIDDGIVSGIRDEQGETELSQSVSQAITLIDSLPPGTKMALIGTSRPGSPLIQEATINKERVRKTLQSLNPGTISSDIIGAMKSARGLIESLSEPMPSSVVMIGSWRRGAFETSSSDVDFTPLERMDWNFLSETDLFFTPPSTKETSIIAIESMSFRKSLPTNDGSSPTMIANIGVRRLGDNSGKIKNTIRLNGVAMDGTTPRGFSIPPGGTRSSLEVEIFLRTEDAARDGSTVVTATLDHKVLPLVSNRSRVADTSRVIRVGMIDRENFLESKGVNDVGSAEWMIRSLDPTRDGSITTDLIDPVSIDSRRLESFDAVIVNRPDLLGISGWKSLQRFSKTGGFILFTPPSDAVLHEWIDEFTNHFDSKMESNPEIVILHSPLGLSLVRKNTPLLSMIESELDDLSSPILISRLIDIDTTNMDMDPILVCNDGRPFLVVWDSNEDRGGAVALLAASPSEGWTNLPVKPLMVPLMQELIRRGSGLKSQSKSLVTGTVEDIEITSAREVVSVTNQSINLDESGRPRVPLMQTGGWRVLDSSGRLISSLVVNPDIESSDPTLMTRERIESWLETLGPWSVVEFNEIKKSFSDDQIDSRFSTILLITVLLIVITETFLNRRFSNSRPAQPMNKSNEGASHA